MISKVLNTINSRNTWIFLVSLLLSIYAGFYVNPTWVMQSSVKDVQEVDGNLWTKFEGETIPFENVVDSEKAILTDEYLAKINASGETPTILTENVLEISLDDKKKYVTRSIAAHWGWWSLLPALVAIALCIIIREPIPALLAGVISGAIILSHNDLADLFVTQLATRRLASIILLYLILLGSLLGIWSRTGAPKVFAVWMSRKFVKGPRSAKFIAWMLGIIFHQGGSMSTVLAGTTVTPLADKENVSHEELSCIVDSTASPIALLIPFNAWPVFVVGLIYVDGVDYLSSDLDRISFFYQCIPLSFYAILAVLFTLLLSFNLLPKWIAGKAMIEARDRAINTGQLNRVEATEPKLANSKVAESDGVAESYEAHLSEFFIPIAVIIGVSMWTYFAQGAAKVDWGFGLGILTAYLMAFLKGMSIKDVMIGIEKGLKNVVVAAIILILAVTIGQISTETGGSAFLLELIGDTVPFWLLPILLQLLTMVISSSTGTSWGTYAVAFPLTMPLAVAMGATLDDPKLYVMICFATVLNGGVYGDQCSPISDTTILSSTTTGANLMDHVKTQLVPASIAATTAAILWTAMTFLCV